LEYSTDSVLNGKIKLVQPQNGYRVAIDPIILSSFVHPRRNQKILDVGCGVGTISLILKMKEISSEITALDVDKTMCEICRQNSAINSLHINVINVGIENAKENLSLKNKLFDQIVTNPPFFSQKSSRISETKRLANFETVNLSDWILFCFKKLKNEGIFSMIHKASRIDDILYSLRGIAGSVQLIPIFPKINCEANRVVIIAKKSSKTETRILQGIVVHEDNGDYSKTMDEILSGKFLVDDVGKSKVKTLL
jgi:tRNA1(Val) A37 N6-methylase TrmN6